ncbi:MAG: hypothetical protein HC919_08965 [Oscillatoriales cyanobacterium SM2_2_1]|nr:hypothetical protein [Oscillatoriales cyanobacterium SM2_2_1]
MMQSALVDTGIWYGIFDKKDERYGIAQSIMDDLDCFKTVVPWPTIYETLRTRFVKNKFALQDFEIFLKAKERSNQIEYLDDMMYRQDAFDLSLESSLRGRRPLSMVDCLLRLIIEDRNVK